MKQVNTVQVLTGAVEHQVFAVLMNP